MIRFAITIFFMGLLAGCMSQPPAPAVDRSVSTQIKLNQPIGPGYYSVKRGEGLSRIARENGVNLRDLMNWNGITNPDVIKEGQVLRIAPPTATEPADAVVTKPIATSSGVESRSLEQPAAPTTSVANGNGLKREPRVGKEPYSDEAYARLNRVGELAKPVEVNPEPKQESKPEAPVVVPGPDDVVWMWPTSLKVSKPYSEVGNKGLDFSGKLGDSILAAADGKVIYVGSGLRAEYGDMVVVQHKGALLSVYAHNRKILVKEGDQVSRGQKIAEMGNADATSVKLHFEIRKQGKPVDPAQYLPKR